MGWLRYLAGNFFFPPKCVFCGRILSIKTEPEMAICPYCQEKIPYTVALPKCKGCGKPIEEHEVYCGICRKSSRKVIRKFSAPYLYQKQVKRSILRFKQETFCGYAETYARHMQAVLEYDCSNIMFELVVSAPPRKKRMRQEDYDQAAWLAQTLAKRMKLPYCTGVLKQKESRRKQSSLSMRERWQNAEGNVIVKKPESVRDKTVLLVDDVCTTGATLYHSALALKEAGAKAVYCTTAAVVEKN